MKTFFKTLLILSLLLVLASLAAGWGLLSWLHDAPGVHLSINGDELMLQGLGEVLGAGLGLVITGLVLFIVLPLVLLLSVGLPLLIVGGLLAVGLAALLGMGALLGSPLILLVLVVWLLVRDRSKTRPSTTQA
jgi:hypothetical protein